MSGCAHVATHPAPSVGVRDELPHPLSAKGFRPFFLLAALLAVAIVPLWLLVLGGVVRSPPAVDVTVWHAHEFAGCLLVYGRSSGVPVSMGNRAEGSLRRDPPSHESASKLASASVSGRTPFRNGSTFPFAGRSVQK